MAGRRNDSSVFDLYDSIEFDCSKWTAEERTAFQREVGITAPVAVANMIAAMVAAQHPSVTVEELSFPLHEPALRGLIWVAHRRRKPRLAFSDVVIDKAAVTAVIAKQIVEGALILRMLSECGEETFALCLSMIFASACDRAPLD
jgi:hypothetical protein